MLKTSQKFYKENNRKVFLKYDGKREDKKFTVKVYETIEPNPNTIAYGKDTNDLVLEFNNVLGNFDYDLSEMREEYISIFSKIVSIVFQEYGESSIIGLTIKQNLDISDNELALLTISSDNSFIDFKDVQLKKLVNMVKEKV